MLFVSVPPEFAIKVLVSDALLVFSMFSAKHWLLVRGVGSLWLGINVLAGGGIGALVYLIVKGRVAFRGDFPVCRRCFWFFGGKTGLTWAAPSLQWKTLVVASGTLFAQQIALFYSLKRLDASR